MNELPDGWAWTTLGEICDAQPGFASGRHNRDGVGVQHLRPMNITRSGSIDLSDARHVEDESDRRVRYGDVLFNNTNSPPLVGKSAFVGLQDPLAYSNHLTRLRCFSCVEPKYVAYRINFLWMTGYFKAVMSNHVNQASVTTRVLLGTRFELPPLSEQRRIVAVLEDRLSRLDAGNSYQKAASSKVDHLRQVLLDRIDGREVPLAEILSESLTNGRSVRTRSDGFPVLRLTAIDRGRIQLQERKCGDWTAEDAFRYLVRRGDFLVSRGNGSLRLVARGGLVVEDPDPVAFPDTMIRIRPDIGVVIPEYLSLVWETRRVRAQIESMARTTAGIYKINQAALNSVRVPLMSLNAQHQAVKEFANRMDAAGRLQASVSETQTRAASLRWSLLADALAGRLVPQDSNDEPASMSLDRIQAERVVTSKPARARKTTTTATMETAG